METCLNTNADTIAGETAKALAEYFDVTLVYCFEKKGVLRDENDDDSVIPVLTPDLFKQYVEEGIVQGGMIPKLENSFFSLGCRCVAGRNNLSISNSQRFRNNYQKIIQKKLAGGCNFYETHPSLV